MGRRSRLSDWGSGFPEMGFMLHSGKISDLESQKSAEREIEFYKA